MPENVEFFISLFSLAFTTTLEIHCQSDWHLPYIMAPRIKHNAFRIICLFSLEFHLILNGDLIITLFNSLSQCLEEYLSKLKGRLKCISLFNDTFSTNSSLLWNQRNFFLWDLWSESDQQIWTLAHARNWGKYRKVQDTLFAFKIFIIQSEMEAY